MNVRHFFIILILCSAVFFVDLGLFDPDLMESRNFITAREMITDGNWMVPTMNNELRLEKQPFITWLTALSALAGNTLTDLTILRIPSALVSILMVFFFYGICFELSKSGRLALTGSIIFSTSLLVVQMARVNSWDIYTHAFMTGSIWLQLKAFNLKENNIKYWLGAALLMGLSVFSKGPVSFYALWLPFIISYFIFYNKENIRFNAWKIALMIMIALLMGFAWNIYIYLMERDALLKVLEQEATSRFERHMRPFYFYFHFAAYIGIWMIPLLASFFVKDFRRKINIIGNYKFMLSWILISLFLLSIIPEKKERFMLPMEIPMCLMVTFLLNAIYSAFEKGYFSNAVKNLLRIQGWLSVILLSALPVAAYIILKGEFFSARYFPGSVLIFVAAIILAMKMKKFNKADSVYFVVFSSVLVVLSVTTLFLPVIVKATAKPDYKNLAEISASNEYKNIPFISAESLNMKLVWRLGKPVIPDSTNTYLNERNGKVVFISYDPIEEIYLKTQINNLNIESIGIFDCDNEKSACKVYVYVIEKKI